MINGSAPELCEAIELLLLLFKLYLGKQKCCNFFVKVTFRLFCLLRQIRNCAVSIKSQLGVSAVTGLSNVKIVIMKY